MKKNDVLQAMVDDILAQDRRALAQGITLVESKNLQHQKDAHYLLDALLPFTGKSIRIGISGTPGVGKSTLIEALGLWLIKQQKRVAVLAVDPTSPLSKGSLLGDKTRMQKLSISEQAFIRPSPSRGMLGGVAWQTREAVLICEAAGFDVVMVETVGVGQSEMMVASMVDTFVLLLQPGGGDELQGVKKGILELADILVITKADGELKKFADEAKREYTRAMALLRRSRVDSWKTPVIKVSALREEGVSELWKSILAHRACLEESGGLKKKRSEQAEQWFWSIIDNRLMEKFRSDDSVRRALSKLLKKIQNNDLSATHAASELLDQFLLFLP